MSALDDALAAYRRASADVKTHRAAWIDLQERRDHALVRLDEISEELGAAGKKRERLLLDGTEPEMESLDLRIRDLEDEKRFLHTFLQAFRSAGPERPDFKLVVAQETALRARDDAVIAYVSNLLAPLRRHRARLTQAAAVLEATVPPGGSKPDVAHMLEMAQAYPDLADFDAALDKAKAECPGIFEPLP